MGYMYVYAWTTFQSVYIDSNTIQFIHAHAFEGITPDFLSIHSSSLLEMPDVTLLRDTLQYFQLICYMKCSLVIKSNHFNGFKLLYRIYIEEAGLSNMSWLVSLRKSAGSVSVQHNGIATLASIYGIEFEKLVYLNLAHNFITAIDIMSLMMPLLLNLRLNNNRISHLDLEMCNLEGKKISIYLLNNPLNCSAHWQWLYDSVVVDENQLHSSLMCGQREIRVNNIEEIMCLNYRGQEYMVRREDFISSPRPEYSDSKSDIFYYI